MSITVLDEPRQKFKLTVTASGDIRIKLKGNLSNIERIQSIMKLVDVGRKVRDRNLNFTVRCSVDDVHCGSICMLNDSKTKKHWFDL